MNHSSTPKGVTAKTNFVAQRALATEKQGSLDFSEMENIRSLSLKLTITESPKGLYVCDEYPLAASGGCS
jgi:hypothetical protein